MTNKKFFTTQNNLYVWDSFLEIMDVEKETEIEIVDYFDLEKSYPDREIEQKPVSLSTVRSLIEMQSNGEAGQLLTNGRANLFYVVGKNEELFVVNVSLDTDDREWGVNAWRRGGYGRWPAGYRVFRNTLDLEQAIKVCKNNGLTVTKIY